MVNETASTPRPAAQHGTRVPADPSNGATAYDSARPQWLDRGQIPGLDGLRAIAVLLVLMVHAYQTVGFPDWPVAKKLFLEGAIGVDIFFILSGFLITTLLVRELERDGHVQLKRFYVRRTLRIIPAYVCLLSVVAICQYVGYFQLQRRDWIGALTYTTNFLYHPSWELGHSWSLSVEEHFYLLWPVVLYAGGVTAAWRAGVGCLIVCWLIRCGIAFGLSPYVLPPESGWPDVAICTTMAESWTITRLDTITIGSLMALYCRSAKGRGVLDRLTTTPKLWFLFVTLCVSIALTQSSKYTLCVAYTVNGLCLALLMWGMVRSQGISRRILSNPVLRVIGLGSYSIYLWQQLFIHPRHPGWIHEFPQNIGFAFAAAFLSFWLIEQPFNRLKDRIAK